MTSIEWSSEKVESVSILTPVYNDWASAAELVSELNTVAIQAGVSITVVMVNDGSTENPPAAPDLVKEFDAIAHLEILHLVTNYGHAKALAIGLAYLAEHRPNDPVVVMDSDGEDLPSDVPRLMDASRNAPEQLIVAHRSRRSEGPVFGAFYRLYKGLFRFLTGRRISFGNFCMIPPAALKRLVYAPELWSHLAATLVRSRFPIQKLSTNRGTRYAGRSKMNFNSLIQHGLGAIAVDLDRVLVRILMTLGTTIVALPIGMIAVVAYRFGTNLATPGWATTVMSGLLVLLVQSALLAVLLLFLDLKTGTNALNAPGHSYKKYIASIEGSANRAVASHP